MEDGFAVAGRYDFGWISGELVQRLSMLAAVDDEAGPSPHQFGRGDQGIADKENARAWEPEGEMTRRVARRVHNLDSPQALAAQLAEDERMARETLALTS